MDPEERELLKKSVDLAQENNAILHSMRRSMHISRIMTFIYWIFIIGSAVGAYFIIQPYLDQLLEVYGGAKSNLNSFNEMFKNFK